MVDKWNLILAVFFGLCGGYSAHDQFGPVAGVFVAVAHTLFLYWIFGVLDRWFERKAD